MLEHDDNNKYYNLKRQKNRGHTALNHSNSTIPLGVTDSLLLTSQAPVSQVKRCSLIRPLFCLTGVPIILIILYHTLAEKARVIFRLRRSDMIATAIVILKPCGFSDILFASKTREANITAKQ